MDTSQIYKIETVLEKWFHQLMDFLPKLATALLVLILGLWVINRVSSLARKAMEKRDLDPSLRSFLRSLLSIGLKVILIVTVAGMVGIGTTSFVTILGAAGLAVGLALQGSLSNFAGGVLILIFKPFKVGDTIEAGGYTGKVLEIQIFNTILQTADRRTVILPNGSLSNNTIVNHSRIGTKMITLTLYLKNIDKINELKEYIHKTVNEIEGFQLNENLNFLVTQIRQDEVIVEIKPVVPWDYTGKDVSLIMEKIYAFCKKENIEFAERPK
ncbi:MAG: mechanosensitive ion channel [Bacteroidia bacterium]|nr:mechanosensitive ion channel [Bacteroidia bacterium]